MPDVVPIVLWSWVPVTLLLFRKLPPPRAAAACLLGGWLILPTARFADSVANHAFPYWIMPACLPSDQWTTKGRIIGLSALLGVMAFDPAAWRRFRPSWLDLPLLGWCLTPLASASANRGEPAAALADSAYLGLSWGVPYLLGRVYFADPAGIATLARSVIAGGLLYVPLCLVEWLAGPVAYRTLYGFHPYQFDGTRRYFGSRPIGLLEHGNQLGIWMASAALVAAWSCRAGQLRRFWGIPGPVVAAVLLGAAIVTQSAGAVVLLAAGLAAIEVVHRLDRTWVLAGALAIPLVFLGARASNLVDVKAVALRTGVGRALAEASNRADRGSLGWRIQVEQRAAKVALARPWFGWGRWDWWRGATEGERPWGLFSLALGMEGAVGWACLVALMAAPLAAFLMLGRPGSWTTVARAPAAALAGALALHEFDAILNACFMLPFLAVAGGLVGLRGHARASKDWVRRLQARQG